MMIITAIGIIFYWLFCLCKCDKEVTRFKFIHDWLGL